jgi:hypothetical protein
LPACGVGGKKIERALGGLDFFLACGLRRHRTGH